MSVGSIFLTNVDPVRVSKAKKKVGAVEGDHITLINIYNMYTRKSKNQRKSMVSEFYINERNMIKAIKIRSQLKEYLYLMGVAINKSDDYDDPPAILKSLITGFFQNLALKQIDGSYKNIRSNEPLEIHPSSVLANIKPKWIIYHDTFVTTKKYIKDVSEVDIDWVLELCPHFYKDTRKEYQQEKYKAESKLNTKRAKDLAIQEQKLKENQQMMESRSSIMKKPKPKMGGNFFSTKKKESASGIPKNRIRRHDLAPVPKDINFDPTKLERMFPNKKQKREGSQSSGKDSSTANNHLSFADEDY